MVKDKGNMKTYSEKDASLVLCNETEFNMASVASEAEEFEDIALKTAPKSNFSEVVLSAKFCIKQTSKKLDDDQETRAESLYDVDSTQFGKGIINALPDVAEGIQTIVEDAVEEEEASEVAEAVPNLRQRKIAKLRAKLYNSRPYEDFKVTCKF